MHKTKNNNRRPWSPLCFGQLLLGMGLLWSMAGRPSDSPLENTDLPSPRRFLLQVASELGMDLCVHIPFSLLGFCLV